MSSPEIDPFSFPLVQSTTARRFRPRRGEEADPRSRLLMLSDRRQEALEGAQILMVGAGAQSYAALGLLRSGCRRLAICDPDFFDMTNFSRQLGYANDAGEPKAHRVARNLRREAISGAEIVSIAAPFPEALEAVPFKPDIVSCLVDDNTCRLAVSQYSVTEHVPAVIAGMSQDGVMAYAFLQDSRTPDAPCIACVFPDLQLIRAPCVASCIKTVFLIDALIINFIEVAIMGWPKDSEPYNFRLADLYGRLESTHVAERRLDCWLCGGK